MEHHSPQCHPVIHLELGRLQRVQGKLIPLPTILTVFMSTAKDYTAHNTLGADHTVTAVSLVISYTPVFWKYLQILDTFFKLLICMISLFAVMDCFICISGFSVKDVVYKD